MPTIHTPDGRAKVRCESNRRYWVIGQWDRNFERVARVEFRTDNIDKARATASKAAGRVVYDSRAKQYTP